jgi:hypothetical protein
MFHGVHIGIVLWGRWILYNLQQVRSETGRDGGGGDHLLSHLIILFGLG